MRDYVRLGGILFVITAVIAFILAVGNYVTKDKITALTLKEKAEAKQAVLKGIPVNSESGEEINVSEGTSVKTITKYITEDGFDVFAVSCGPKGYGGEISMMIGVDQNLKVTGVSIIDNSNETPGLGARVKETKFYEQFIGKTKGVGVNKTSASDKDVQAITGATISSKAVAKGVNDAISAVEEVVSK